MNTKLSLAVIAATLAASPAAMAQTTGNTYQNNASESGYERSSPSGLPTTSPQVRSLPGEQPDPWDSNRAVGTQSWNSPSRGTAGSSMGPNDRLPAYGNTYGTPANPGGERAMSGSTYGTGTGTMEPSDRAPAYGNTYGTDSNRRALSNAVPGDMGPNDRSPAYGNTYGTETNRRAMSNTGTVGTMGTTGTMGGTMGSTMGSAGSTGTMDRMGSTGSMGTTGDTQGGRQVLMNVDPNVQGRAGRGQNRTELMQTSLLNYFSAAGFTSVRDFRKQGQNYVAEAQDQNGRWSTVELDPRTGTITALR